MRERLKPSINWYKNHLGKSRCPSLHLLTTHMGHIQFGPKLECWLGMQYNTGPDGFMFINIWCINFMALDGKEHTCQGRSKVLYCSVLYKYHTPNESVLALCEWECHAGTTRHENEIHHCQGTLSKLNMCLDRKSYSHICLKSLESFFYPCVTYINFQLQPL